MKKCDYIIVGQGLAGTLLAYCLWREGKKIVVIDRDTEGGESSNIAAGIINPITGKRFVKSWKIDELLPVAHKMYAELGRFLNVKIWHDRPIIRTLHNVEEENNWLLRSTYDDYKPYCGAVIPNVPNDNQQNFKPFHAFATIRQGAQVNMPLLVNRFRHFLKELDMFLPKEIDEHNLTIEGHCVFFDGIEAQKIILCEGAYAAHSDFFSWLPFNPDKGELLLVRIPNLGLKAIFKNKITIVPLHDTEGGLEDTYWVGATNEWQFDDALPTEKNRELIINELQHILNVPFEVIDHKAAIRPTVKDRRPFIGLHPNFKVLGIFNGFGTKGASLIPYWAEHFTQHLLRGQPIDDEVNISRFLG